MKPGITLFVGSVPAEFAAEGEYFTNARGEQFYFKVTSDSEGILIEDTCNRHLPIDAEQLDMFTRVLCSFNQIQALEEELTDAMNEGVREIMENHGGYQV
ncbi:hypothetical protein UFOVP273_51 [uncultured Caudovirales phage]|uniref:Uncharacterized protein n=1 Tax=uncultured Caudovirales phage TaxID=2100421 RepID=A0A6J5LJM6_9CAUD|nr:hypothetical protein UFOVP273_51 [uncultured Caudovirales phage]